MKHPQGDGRRKGHWSRAVKAPAAPPANANREARRRGPPAYVDHHGRPGRWQLEGHCGDCGAIVQRGKPVLHPHLCGGGLVSLPGQARLPKLCSGYYNGRPGGRCGFVLSWVWIFYPASKV